MTPATTPNRNAGTLKIDDKHAQKFEAVTILRREKHDNDTWEWQKQRRYRDSRRADIGVLTHLHRDLWRRANHAGSGHEPRLQ